MAFTDRAAEAVGGPRGGSTWYDCGDSFTLQNHTQVTATTTNNQLPMQTVARPNLSYLNGTQLISNQDVLGSDNVIQTLFGFQITFVPLTAGGTIPATTTLRLTMSVFGSVGTLLAALVAPTAITSISLLAPVTRNIPSGSVLTLTPTTGATATVTTSAAVNVGTSIIPINSFTSALTFPVLTPVTWQVGNQPAFGWRSTADGDTGTPVFPPNVGILAPAVAANTSLIVGAAGSSLGSCLVLQPADALICMLKMDAGSLVLPIANLQPLII